MARRRILHVDMDAFFASVEVRDDPELRGKPVLVGGAGKRGVVAAASYEAREYGCHSAQPMAVALRHCPHAVVVKGRHEAYREASQEVFEVFRRYTPLVEALSIDEAFLDLTGTERLHGTAEEAAEKIRRDVHDSVHLTCSVGVASVKFVAKIASDMNKPDGLTVVPDGREREFLDRLPVRKLWGVGPKTAQSLERFGVTTIGDIARLDPNALTSALGEHGAQLHRLALGIDAREIEVGREAKSIGHENTYDEDLVGVAALEKSMIDQATRVADRLVRQNLRGRQVQIKIRTHDFGQTWTRQATLDEPTNEAAVIFAAARALLHKVPVFGRRFRLTGVSVGQLTEEAHQLDLLARDQKPSVQSVLTSIRDKFGGQALFPGDPGSED